MAVTSPVPSHPPSLPAHHDADTDQVVRSGLLHELSHAFGGPFHFLLPSRFDANLAAFGAVLEETGVEGRVHYAKKANKAAVWTERCAQHRAGIDVASVGELREALGGGVRGEHIVVTGPAKSADLLRLAVHQSCLIAVDSLDELDLLATLAFTGTVRPARTLLRCLPPDQPHSRFGLDPEALETALDRCVRAGDTVRMEGFSFHLSGYASQPRTDLAGRLVEMCLRARRLGLQADRISIGGGFAVDYAAAEHWQAFLDQQRPEHYHANKTFRAGDFYPYHSPVAGAEALRAIVTAVPEGGARPLAELLKETGTLLMVEPGRALLDRAGATVFGVQGVKHRNGYCVVTADGTSLSLSEQWFNSEYLPDPLLVTAQGVPDPGRTHPAAVGGASCLESDMLTWRKVPLPALPRIGDLLVYLNTAGYQMDSNESSFHDLPLPPKVVIDRLAGRPRWRLDRRPVC
ncbi:Y4yA family PLP-dependent enzyme [Streptomyces malaysiensis]|uniref:Y4yA family PLP-dependent enzyme n=1 Tax=Streptomyces malaysiensis TaxID=92644 RepID=UPI0011CDCCAA|nr:Y4yA family PLP-dependent enzyme [Streptomyces malaysiensis]